MAPEANDDDAILAELLRKKIREKAGERGYSKLDRQLGRGGTGWTSKFLRGKERVSTISALLKILRAIDVEPAEFFLEAFPLPPPKGLDEDKLVARFIESLASGGAAYEALQRLIDRRIAERAASETEVRRERQAAGIAAAKASGKKWGGRKKGARYKVSPVTARQIRIMAAEEVPVAEIARRLGISRPTVYSVLNDE